MEKLPILIALGVILVTALLIYVFAVPVLCRFATSATILC